jgi:hypothetical protein
VDRRTAWPAGLAVGRVEIARQARQHPVRPPLDLTQRVIRRDQILNVERVKNGALRIHSTAHPLSSLKEAMKYTQRRRVRGSFLATC